MIPALPTVAPELEHHRGFQTFAVTRGIVRAAVIGAARHSDSMRHDGYANAMIASGRAAAAAK
jgi:hypothetical protein